MPKFHLILAAAALPLAACAQTGMDRPMAAAPMLGDMTPEEANAYVTLAASSDMYEITSSREALAKSRNPQIRQFAQTMIDHHTRTTQQLKDITQREQLPPPPMSMVPLHQQMVEELRGLNGTAFERAYLAQQQRAHEMALALHRNYAASGDRPALRSFGATAVPIIEQHIAQLRAIRT